MKSLTEQIEALYPKEKEEFHPANQYLEDTAIAYNQGIDDCKLVIPEILSLIREKAFRAGYDCGVNIQCSYDMLWEEAEKQYNEELEKLK